MAYFTPYTIVDFFSGSQRCGSLVFFYFQGKSHAVYRSNKPANVEKKRNRARETNKNSDLGGNAEAKTEANAKSNSQRNSQRNSQINSKINAKAIHFT